MTPARSNGDSGGFMLDRVFEGVGRIHRSSKAVTLRDYHRRDALLTKLFENGEIEILRAFRDKQIGIAQLIDNDRRGQIGTSLEMIRLRTPLWKKIDALLPLMAQTVGTREWYQFSLNQLKALPTDLTRLTPHSLVTDLARVPWKEVEAAWDKSAVGWNRLRSAVSRFLTLATGDVYSPFRRQVVKMIPKRREGIGRTPDLSPAEFVRALDRLERESDKAAAMCFALTGMRAMEYLGCDKDSLLPNRRQIIVPDGEGSKTGGRIVAIDAEDWHWIELAVPYEQRPVPSVRRRANMDSRYKRLRQRWADALKAEKIPHVRLHDLRHCAGQWASDAGASGASVSDLLGHADSKTARKYERMKAAARASGLIGATLRLVRSEQDHEPEQETDATPQKDLGEKLGTDSTRSGAVRLDSARTGTRGG